MKRAHLTIGAIVIVALMVLAVYLGRLWATTDLPRHYWPFLFGGCMVWGVISTFCLHLAITGTDLSAGTRRLLVLLASIPAFVLLGVWSVAIGPFTVAETTHVVGASLALIVGCFCGHLLSQNG